MRIIVIAAVVLAACRINVGPTKPRDLTTEAERSGWTRTGRYAEVERLCAAYAAAFPAKVRCETFGTTPERRPMLALVVSGDGTLTPEAARRRGRPVLLIQGGIHAGEIEGKDAGLWLLRDLLEGDAEVLRAVTIVFVPVFNVDGHERFGPNHRPNQRGPVEMGFRTNAGNLNLNRDYVKVDTPEMAAMLALFGAWDPVVYVDLHTTNGAKFEHDIAVLVEPRTGAGAALSDAIQAGLAARGHLPLPFYPSFIVYDDPASGFDHGDPPPRFSQAYAAARGRIGILVETHSWRTYPERIRSTRNLLEVLLERAGTDAAAWRQAADAADAAGARLAGAEVVLTHDVAPTARTIEFRGYRYQRVPSEVSGGTWTIYDESTPELWRVPYYDVLVPALTVRAPAGGYLVHAGFAAAIAPRLDAHGIAYTTLAEAAPVDGEVFRATKVTRGDPFEARTRITLEGAWAREARHAPAGSLWVPIDQPRARLILHLFEPAAPDSLASWGFFDAVFEQKEYLEGYVAEEVARQMLRDPAVKAAFDAALADPEFAKDPRARLRWFHRRHPSWDERKDLLPVWKLPRAPGGAADRRAAGGGRRAQ